MIPVCALSPRDTIDLTRGRDQSRDRLLAPTLAPPLDRPAVASPPRPPARIPSSLPMLVDTRSCDQSRSPLAPGARTAPRSVSRAISPAAMLPISLAHIASTIRDRRETL
uniref:Uncharacterized protein n=1 Tax=Knipowitschia caucasica TaxID=637954 RepID=A0AAV2L1U3_KNICA